MTNDALVTSGCGPYTAASAPSRDARWALVRPLAWRGVGLMVTSAAWVAFVALAHVHPANSVLAFLTFAVPATAWLVGGFFAILFALRGIECYFTRLDRRFHASSS